MDETCCDLRGDRCGAGRRGRRGRGGNGCAHPPPARAPATRGRRQRQRRAAGARQAQPHQPDGPLRTGYLSAGRPAARGCAAASSTCGSDDRLQRRGRRCRRGCHGNAQRLRDCTVRDLGRRGADARASAAPTPAGGDIHNLALLGADSTKLCGTTTSPSARPARSRSRTCRPATTSSYARSTPPSACTRPSPSTDGAAGVRRRARGRRRAAAARASSRRATRPSWPRPRARRRRDGGR